MKTLRSHSIALVVLASCYLATAASAQNGASSWTRVLAPAGKKVTQLSVEPNKEMYVQVDGRFYQTPFPVGRYAWQHITNVLSPTVFGTSMGTSLSGELVVGTSNRRIYRFDATSRQWTYTEIAPPGGNTQNVFGLYSDSLTQMMFAATDGGIYESYDGGRIWGLSSASPFLADSYCFTRLFDGRILAGGRQVIRVHNDQKLQWDNLDTLSNFTYVRALLQTPNGMILVGTQPFGFCRSTNNGKSWTRLDTSIMGKNIRAFVQVDPTEVLAGTLDSGVWKSMDGGITWTHLDAGNQPRKVYSFTKMRDGTLFASTYANGVYRSIDKGESWVQMTSLPQSDVYKTFVQHDTIFATTQRVTYMSSDRGTSWSPIAPRELMDVHQLVVAPKIGTLLATFLGLDDSTLYRSRDDGASWDPVQIPDQGHGYYVAGMAAHSNGSIYAIVQGRDSLLTSMFLRSDDDGYRWIPIGSRLHKQYYSFALDSAGNMFAGYYPSSGAPGIEKIPIADSRNFPIQYQVGSLPDWIYLRSDTELYAGLNSTGVGYFHATPSLSSIVDTGIFSITRIPCMEPTPDGLLFCSAVYPYNDQPRYVLRLKPDSIRWHSSDTNFIRTVTALRYGGDGYLYAGVQDSGIWQYKIDIPANVPVPSVSSERLVTCYPNPMSSHSTLEFFSPRQGHADVLMLDVLGNQVAQVYSGEVPQGRSTISWQRPIDLPTGLYECIIRINGVISYLPIVIEQ